MQTLLVRALIFMKARFSQRRCLDLSQLEGVEDNATTEGDGDWAMLNLPSDPSESDHSSRDSFESDDFEDLVEDRMSASR